MSPTPISSRQGKTSGFTLIEVAIAVAILAVSLVALLGLMPAGMTNFRKAMDTSITAQIAQRILLDMGQADFDQVIDAPKSGTDNISPSYTFTAPTRTLAQNALRFRYFDEQGSELIPLGNGGTSLSAAQKTALVYQVNVRVMPKAAQPADSKISGAVALVTVQVARNPNSRDLEKLVDRSSDPNASEKPMRNLIDTSSATFKKTPLQIYTYSALIGKNQG